MSQQSKEVEEYLSKLDHKNIRIEKKKIIIDSDNKFLLDLIP